MKANSFIADYEIIRELMHAVLRFGTITPEQINISPSKYNKMKPLLRTALQDNIEDRRYQKGAQRSLHITADTFSEGLSALSSTYMVKSIKHSELCIRLFILQLLKKNGSMDRTQIVDEVTSMATSFVDIDARTIISQCRHLEDYGQITSEKRGKQLVFSLNEDVFADIPADTMCDLAEMVSFFRNLTAPFLCGEQLFRSLGEQGDANVDDSHFLVAGVNIGYVLDDAVLYDLLPAIENQFVISFDYTDQYHAHPNTSRILPLAVHESEPLGRRYLAALDLNDDDKLILFRLDYMKNVTVSKEYGNYTLEQRQEILDAAFRCSVSGAHLPNGEPVSVRIKYAPEFETTLRKQFPNSAQFIQEGGNHIAVISVNHPLELKAFLRTNAAFVQTLPNESNRLYEDMKQEAQLWRERYGIES